jgi:hypothetical protein
MGQREEKSVSSYVKAASDNDEGKDFTDKKMGSHSALLMVMKTSVHTRDSIKTR